MSKGGVGGAGVRGGGLSPCVVCTESAVWSSEEGIVEAAARANRKSVDDDNLDIVHDVLLVHLQIVVDTGPESY